MKPYFIYDEKGNQISVTEEEFIIYCANNIIQETEEMIRPKNKLEQFMTNEEKKLFLTLA